MKLLINVNLELDLSPVLIKRLLNVMGDDDTIKAVLKDKLESNADLWGMGFPPDDDYDDNMSVVELLFLDAVSQRENDSE